MKKTMIMMKKKKNKVFNYIYILLLLLFIIKLLLSDHTPASSAFKTANPAETCTLLSEVSYYYEGNISLLETNEAKGRCKKIKNINKYVRGNLGKIRGHLKSITLLEVKLVVTYFMNRFDCNKAKDPILGGIPNIDNFVKEYATTLKDFAKTIKDNFDVVKGNQSLDMMVVGNEDTAVKTDKKVDKREDAVKRLRRTTNGILKTSLQSYLNLPVDKVAASQYPDIILPLVELFKVIFKHYDEQILTLRELLIKLKNETKSDQSKLFGNESLKIKQSSEAPIINNVPADDTTSTDDEILPPEIPVTLQSNELIAKTTKLVPKVKSLLLEDLPMNTNTLEPFKSNLNYAVLSSESGDSDKTLLFVMKLQPLHIQQKILEAIRKDDDESLKQILRREAFFAIFAKRQSSHCKEANKLIKKELDLDNVLDFLSSTSLDLDEDGEPISWKKTSVLKDQAIVNGDIETMDLPRIFYFVDNNNVKKIFQSVESKLRGIYPKTNEASILM